jgi:transposase-like protein
MLYPRCVDDTPPGSDPRAGKARETSMPGNNQIEQDHRGVKLRIGPMLGFKRFKTAAITLAGIELLRKIHKGQLNLGKLRPKDRSAPAVWNAVLAAR